MPRVSSAATAYRRLPELGTVPAGLAAGVISGATCFAAFPPADLWVLAPVALAPMALHFAVAGRRAVAASAVAFGVTFNGLLLYWIRLFGPAPYIALTIVQTLWILAALQIGVSVRKRMPERVRFLAFPLVFLLQEYARSQLPWGGFAWGGLGYTQHDNLLALKLAAYTGVWGLSFIVALINSVLAESILRYRGRRELSFVAAGLAALILFPGLLPVSSPDGPRATVAMVQGNVPEDTLDPNVDDEIVVENHVRLTDQLAGERPDLVVWPEGAFDQDPLRRPDFRQELVDTVERSGSYFLVGAMLGSGVAGDLRNSSVLVNPRGQVESIYTKQRLVPFGEWVPLRSFLQPLVADLDRIPFDQKPGNRPTVFSIPEGRFASVICYESTYPDLVRSLVRRGARMLVVSTNFSSFDRSAASAQHVAFSQLRAAEQRMWVAHTSISGLSAVVAPDGRVLERTSLFEPAVLTPTVRFATSTTPYARLGDWVPITAVIAVLGVLAMPALRRSRQPVAVETSSV